MHATEIVVGEVERDGCFQITQFARKSHRQSGESTGPKNASAWLSSSALAVKTLIRLNMALSRRGLSPLTSIPHADAIPRFGGGSTWPSAN